MNPNIFCGSFAMINFRFTAINGSSSSSQFFDLILRSERFVELIKFIISGDNVDYGDVYCEHYDADSIDALDDEVPYTGAKFSVLGQENLFPPETVSQEKLYDLLEKACEFYIQDNPQRRDAREIFSLVKSKRRGFDSDFPFSSE